MQIVIMRGQPKTLILALFDLNQKPFSGTITNLEITMYCGNRLYANITSGCTLTYDANVKSFEFDLSPEVTENLCDFEKIVILIRGAEIAPKSISMLVYPSIFDDSYISTVDENFYSFDPSTSKIVVYGAYCDMTIDQLISITDISGGICLYNRANNYQPPYGETKNNPVPTITKTATSAIIQLPQAIPACCGSKLKICIQLQNQSLAYAFLD